MGRTACNPREPGTRATLANRSLGPRPEPWAKMATVKDDECDEDDCVAVMFGLTGRTVCNP